MRSYVLDDLKKAAPIGFFGAQTDIKNTVLDPKSNVVIQAAIMQKTSISNTDTLGIDQWSTVTAVRGSGRGQGLVSTPTKGIPNALGYELAQQVGALESQWQGKDLEAAISGPREQFFDASSVVITDNAYLEDIWHTGPDNSDLLANEITHLLIAKFGQKLSEQMTNHLLRGERSFVCRQVSWVAGYSIDWVDGDNVSGASIEPNIMVGAIVLMRNDLDLTGNTLTYSSFGLTTVPDFNDAMALTGDNRVKALAPYSHEQQLHRSYTSMCTEVTLNTINTVKEDPKFQNIVTDGYARFSK